MHLFTALVICGLVCFSMSDTCPSGICDRDQTCCNGPYPGMYGCCNLPNAVCCSDGLHCCPEGTDCNLAKGTCDDKRHFRRFTSVFEDVSTEYPGPETTQNDVETTQTEYEWSTLAPSTPTEYGWSGWSTPPTPSEYTTPSYTAKSVLLETANRLTVVYCPGGLYFCPDGNTCCLLPSGQYGCCPYPVANCCRDGRHCCPNGSHCDVTSQYCIRGDSKFAALFKMPAFSMR